MFPWSRSVTDPAKPVDPLVKSVQAHVMSVPAKIDSGVVVAPAGTFSVTPNLAIQRIPLPYAMKLDVLSSTYTGPGSRTENAFVNAFLYAYLHHGGIEITPVAVLLHLQVRRLRNPRKY